MEAQYLLVSSLLLTLGVIESNSICYDHQRVNYDSKFQVAECNEKCTVSPFFSPDHSVDTYLDLIRSAEKTIDLYTPGFNSWSKCTKFSEKCNTCMGCSLNQQQHEEFPIFAALLNAVHLKGIRVQIITNNFTQTSCPGQISPLDWLYLNGIQIRSYTTTTFMHAKVVIVDHGKRTSISSVNFSWTSFMKNREAGVVIENCSCQLLDLYSQVFQYDWDNGNKYKIYNTYSPADMSIITNKSPMEVVLPDPKKIPGAYVTNKVTYRDVLVNKGFASPDGAREAFLSVLSAVKSSLQVAIYQITDKTICSSILDLFKAGVNVTVLVSDRIVSSEDHKMAQDCYSKLYSNNMQGRIRKSFSGFSFSHQKYWIIDRKTVHLSTGNWSPADFPAGSTFHPYSISNKSVNRNMLVTMTGSDIVSAFSKVFNEDWDSGTTWAPKHNTHKRKYSSSIHL